MTTAETYEAIAGVVDLSTGIVFSIFHAIRNGLIDYDTGVILLEAQVIVSDLIFPETRQCLDLEEALRCQLVDQHIFNQLKQLSDAIHTSSALSGTSDIHPTVAAHVRNALSEVLVIKVLEAQLATGGLQVPITGEKLSLEEAFQRKFVTAQIYFKLTERQKMCTELIDPSTSEKVSLMELMQRTIVDEDTNLRLVPVRPQESSTVTLKSGRETNVFRAVHEGLIDREVMIRILGAQLFAGGLIDPQTERRLTVDEALECGLIDHDTASALLTHQVETGGIVNPKSGCRLTMDEAVQCNLITSSSALLVLESQKVFMGLIWPDSGEIFSIDTSLQQGVVTNELACKILSNRQKIAALYIPESSLVLAPEEATVKGIIDQKTAHVLSTIRIPDLMPRTNGVQLSCADISDWTPGSELESCAASDSVDTEEPDGDEKSTENQKEVQQRFMIDLMMHSYMDAGTGRRLLLVDSDLNEKVQRVMEASSEGDPFENWPEFLCDHEGAGIKSHLECTETSRDTGTDKWYNDSESWQPGVLGGKQPNVASRGQCGNMNCEELFWVPELQLLPVSEDGEVTCSQTANGLGNAAAGDDGGRTLQATETLEKYAEPLEGTSNQGASSPHRDLNESITMASGIIHSLGSELQNQLKENWKLAEDDAALEPSDSGVQEKVDCTLPDAVQQMTENVQTLTDQLFPSCESQRFTPFPLEVDFRDEFGEDLKKMLGFDGGRAGQEDMLVNSTECGTRNLNVEEFAEPSGVEEPNNAKERRGIAVTAVEHHKTLADEAMQWLPLEQQVPTAGAELIPYPLESEARNYEGPARGSNKITSVPSLEDIADAHEMVDFVGEGLSEDMMDAALKIKEDMEFDIDDTSAFEANDVMFEDADVENQTVLQKFTEETKDFTTDQGSMKEMRDAGEQSRIVTSETMSSAFEANDVMFEDADVENQTVLPKFMEESKDCTTDHGSMKEMRDGGKQNRIVTCETLRSRPMKTDAQCSHSMTGTESHESEKQREIMIIETLDDIADVEDRMVVEEPVVISDTSQNEKPYHCTENYKDDALGNEWNGSSHADVGDNIHQHIESTSAVDNGESWRSKVIVCVEGLDDIAETQEMPWFEGDFTGGKEVQIIHPEVEDFEGLFASCAPMSEGEMIFLNGEGLGSDRDEQVRSNQSCCQDFGAVAGQDKSQGQVGSWSVQENHQTSELDKSMSDLANAGTTLMGTRLTMSSIQQEKESDWAMPLANAEDSCIGRRLYDLEEEEEDEKEDGGQVASLEAVKNAERDRCILIKQFQSAVEAGGIFDPVTGQRCGLDTALERGFLDEDMVVDILVSQFQDGGITSEETGENVTLCEAVTKGLLQSHVAIKVLGKLGLIGGLYNSSTGEITEVAEVAEHLVNDKLLAKILLSEKAVSGVIHPETNKPHSINDSVRLGILDSSTALHLLEGQVVSGGIVDLYQEGRLSVAMALKLCLVDAGHVEQLIKIERAKNGEQVDKVTRLKALSYQFETHGVLDPQTGQPLSAVDLVKGGFVERDAVLSVLRKQVEDGGIIQHKSGLRLSVTNALKRGLINENLATDLFGLEVSCQNICNLRSESYLLPQERNLSPSDFSVEVKRNFKSNQFFTEFDEVGPEVGNSFDEGLKEGASFFARRGYIDYNHLDAIPYSDLVKISNIDIETGQRYMAVKPHQESLDAGKIEAMSKLKAADVDLTTACSNHRKDLNDETLIPTKEDEITVQDFATKYDQNHSRKPLESDTSVSGDSFPNNELSEAGIASAEDVSINQSSIASKSSGSFQDNFFMYIRECTSDLLPEVEISESSDKGDIPKSEEKLNDEGGTRDVETNVGEKCVEELDLNSTASSTGTQDLISNKTSDKRVDVERVSPDVKIGLHEQPSLDEMLTDQYSGAQSIGCDDNSEVPEQKGILMTTVENEQKSVCVETHEALKDGPSGDVQNPINKPETSGNNQERKIGETSVNIVDVETKGELVCRMEETENQVSTVSGARGEVSAPDSQISSAESEIPTCQDGVERLQVLDAGDHNLRKSLQEIEQTSSEMEEKGSSVVLEKNAIHSENTISKGEPLERVDVQRVPGVNGETGSKKDASLFSSMEQNTEIEHTDLKPAPNAMALSGDAQSAVKKIDLLLGSLKQVFSSQEFNESDGLKGNKSTKVADLLAGLKPEMLSPEVQDMFCVLSEEQDPLKTQELITRLTDELSHLVQLEEPGLMEDGFLDRQMKEALYKNIPMLFSTEGVLQNASWQTVKEGKDNVNQMKANGGSVTDDSVMPSACSTGALESQEGTAKVGISDKALNGSCFNETILLKQAGQGDGCAILSGNILDEMEFLEDALDKAALEDTADTMWISRNKLGGDLKEEYQFKQPEQNTSGDADEMIQSDPFNKMNQENICKLPPDGVCHRDPEDCIVKESTPDGQNINEGKDGGFLMQPHSFNGKDKLREVREDDTIANASSNACDAHAVNEREEKSNSQNNHKRTSKDSFAMLQGHPEVAEQPGTTQEQVLKEESPNCFWIGENEGEKKEVEQAIASGQNTGKPVHEDPVEGLTACGEKSSIKVGPHEVCRGTAENHETDEGDGQPRGMAQQCWQHRQKLQAHLTLLQERKVQLESQQTVDKNLETLQEQLCYLKLLKSELEEPVTHSLRAAEELLEKCRVNADEAFLRSLETDRKDLQAARGDMMEVCTSRIEALECAIEAEQLKVRATYQELLATLERLSGHIGENAVTLEALQAETACDVQALQHHIQQHKDLEAAFTDIKTQLEGTAFDIQFFISEHALDLAPEENRSLLKLLNKTQTSFRSVMGVMSAQMRALNLKLQTRLEEDAQKV
ncbi:uncharacterized protein LOC144593812 [Rhinoraja longicauda]